MTQRLYIIAPSLAGPCKIGMGADAQTRLDILQPGNPRRLRVYFVSACPSGPEAERLVHAKLRHFRLMREWFNVSVYEAQRAVAEVSYDDWEWWEPVEMERRAQQLVERLGAQERSHV